MHQPFLDLKVAVGRDVSAMRIAKAHGMLKCLPNCQFLNEVIFKMPRFTNDMIVILLMLIFKYKSQLLN